ncbi:MAG: xylulokinase [Beutenbergiaceae bacterium]
MSALVAVVDAGTTGVRSALLDEHGTIVSEHAVPLLVHHPQPGAAQQEIGDLWAAVVETLARACLDQPDGTEICAVNISAQRASVALVDSAGEPVTPLLLWMDLRGGQILAELAQVGPRRFTRISGTPFGAMPAVTRLLWLRSRIPESYRRADRIIGVADAITARLVGSATPMDLTCAAWTGMLDISTGQWSKVILDELALAASLMPSLAWATDVVGVVSAAAAATTGLPVGVPVLAGGGDQQYSSAGAGAWQPGMASINLGTSATYVAAVQPETAVGAGMVRGAHLVQGVEDREGTIPSCGSALRWVAQTMGFGDNAAGFQRLAADVAQTPAGSDGLRFHALFAGSGTPAWQPRVAAMTGLELRHGRSHVARAVVESIGVQLRHIVSIANDVGQQVPILPTIGGLARSPALCQVLADTSRQPLQVPDGDPQQSALRGAAAVGFTASDTSMELGAGAGRLFEPNDAHAAIADDLYATYQDALSDSHEGTNR